MKRKKISDLFFTNRISTLFPTIFVPVGPTPLKNPELIHFNKNLAEKLEISESEFQKPSTLQFLNGDIHFEGIDFKSSVYSGHQFGQFVPRLGDGRAILLGEIQLENNDFFELQLKGSGITPFSRMGDGKTVLRSSIREYLASAHLHALGIPTTEALSLVKGDEAVYREEIESAAIILRSSQSFLRFGHFEYLHFHGPIDELKKLVDTTIAMHFSQFQNLENRYILFFMEVVKRTAKLMAQWQSVGFCHGVMNSDNMSILGLTIDYGPFGFIDRFDLDHICNHSDHEGRYSFGNQAPIAKWNLEKLSIALSSLINENDRKMVLSNYENTFHVEYQRLLRSKLGLKTIKENDELFLRNMLKMLSDTKMDYTQFFRQLCYYNLGQRTNGIPDSLASFLDNYDLRLKSENSIDEVRQDNLKTINPKFVLRNYLAQICIDDISKISKMFEVLTHPYDEWEEFNEWASPAPEKYQQICVSCSS